MSLGDGWRGAIVSAAWFGTAAPQMASGVGFSAKLKEGARLAKLKEGARLHEGSGRSGSGRSRPTGMGEAAREASGVAARNESASKPHAVAGGVSDPGVGGVSLPAVGDDGCV